MTSLTAATPSADAVGIGLWLLLALVVPGAIALDLLGSRSRGYDRAARAVGLSVCLWPLALLWGDLVGVAWSPSVLRVALVGGAGWVVFRAVRGPRPWRGALRPSCATVALTVVLLLAFALRGHQAAGLVVPPWVDGLHHSVIAHLIAGSGRLPTSLRPYAAVDAFYYHFGFHALAGAVAAVARIPAWTAVLWTGQALSAVACLPLYALARRVSGGALAAVAAAAIPATLYTFPAYFVSWSRYTQLAGLVVLPVAWLLLAEVEQRGRPWRALLLAGLAAGGLALVHYRVAAYFAVGVCVWVAWLVARRGRGSPAAILGVGSVALLAFALVAPWLLRRFAGGVRLLAGASPSWLAAPEGVDAVPAWLFRTYGNALWISLAARGLGTGLARRQAGAFGLAACMALAVLLVRPDLVGLPTSWVLPPFSLAISLYLPVGIGFALLVGSSSDWLDRAVGRPRSRQLLATSLVAVAAAGAVQTRDILNPVTVIATPADLAAARWVSDHTPPDAVFLVSTVPWHLGTYRGLDGGYWLGLLADRQVSIPPALYPYGEPYMVRRIDTTAAIAARGDALTDEEMLALLREVGATHVYSGPAGADSPSKLGADRLRRAAFLREVYARDGVHVFEVVAPLGREGRKSAPAVASQTWSTAPRSFARRAMGFGGTPGGMSEYPLPNVKDGGAQLDRGG